MRKPHKLNFLFIFLDRFKTPAALHIVWTFHKERTNRNALEWLAIKSYINKHKLTANLSGSLTRFQMLDMEDSACSAPELFTEGAKTATHKVK